ncbi:hypothetical protein ANCDUO_00472 [Ancylostoma duodenale]|uniref:Uncharacterized protein n=1 Tax=Ancylostoma duodenale TaxID=51022 RepID=A0A0C2DGU0_9BILA|nr:hypothetical protein ANCDUO_00472 [Ancylostoma duodenale]
MRKDMVVTYSFDAAAQTQKIQITNRQQRRVRHKRECKPKKPSWYAATQKKAAPKMALAARSNPENHMKELLLECDCEETQPRSLRKNLPADASGITATQDNRCERYNLCKRRQSQLALLRDLPLRSQLTISPHSAILQASIAARKTLRLLTPTTECSIASLQNPARFPL